jgi:hypothetical protein
MKTLSIVTDMSHLHTITSLSLAMRYKEEIKKRYKCVSLYLLLFSTDFPQATLLRNEIPDPLAPH